MAKFLLLSFTAVLLSFTIATAKITVACAANMQYAMQEIMAAFNKKDTTVNAVYGASGNLVTQIRNGAPFDIFVSADMSYTESLFVNKDAIAKPKIYAYGKLVILSMKKGIVDKGMSVFKDPGIKTIAVPDPLHAPYGREAMKALRKANIYDSVASRLVFGESISQATQYIIAGSADIGFTAKAVVLSDKLKGKGEWKEIDSALYDPIAQGAVICKYGKEKDPVLSQEFFQFLFSDTAGAILKKYGFTLP